MARYPLEERGGQKGLSGSSSRNVRSCRDLTMYTQGHWNQSIDSVPMLRLGKFTGRTTTQLADSATTCWARDHRRTRNQRSTDPGPMHHSRPCVEVILPIHGRIAELTLIIEQWVPRLHAAYPFLFRWRLISFFCGGKCPRDWTICRR